MTPTGDLYPCHQFVGHDEFKLGDVFHGVERNDIVEEFKLCNVYAKDKCRIASQDFIAVAAVQRIRISSMAIY